jgi:hypothetical protein
MRGLLFLARKETIVSMLEPALRECVEPPASVPDH